MINWLVPQVLYTPERYYIAYGLESTILDSVSDTVDGTMELTATNLHYSHTLYGLHPFTQYYYKLVAENSFPNGSSETTVFTFLTTEAGMLLGSA